MQDKKLYIETYGCQMNVADSEVVMSLMTKDGYQLTEDIDEADVILVNTCSVRENAEDRVTARLNEFKTRKKENPEVVVGVLGCMAERLNTKFFETHTTRKSKVKIADLIVGPDEYRKLPELVEKAQHGEQGIAAQSSCVYSGEIGVETYDDIIPLRTNGLSAWVTVMRGCNNFCTFCVVPFTRGRERSRPLQSILKEIKDLSKQGYKEVTLLGQNVNSYSDGNYDFADLMKKSAEIDRGMRIRFTTSHPADMSDKLIRTIAAEHNICNYIHLPAQSGSDKILTLMNRKYTTSHYLKLIEKIRKAIPSVSLTTDIITGFPTETEADHRMTVELMKQIRFDGAFMFAYSPRENTKAWSIADDVSQEEKLKRLSEIIEIQNKISYENNLTLIGKNVEVLIEGTSKRSEHQLKGKTDTNKKVILPRNGFKVGDFVTVKIESVNSATLFGTDKN